MRDDLHVAVENLYRAFAHRALPEEIGYCDHCVDPEQVEALATTPLRQLTSDQLGPYLMNTSVWGDEEYFKHFLPRLLDLVASGDMENYGYPVFLLGRLARCRTEGTKSEQKALAGFLNAWWSATISAWPSRCKWWDVLETIEQSGERVVPYLDALLLDPGEPAARHLADFIKDRTVASYTGSQYDLDVDHWMRGSGLSVRLNDAIRRSIDPAVTAELTDALETITFIQSLPMFSAD